MKELVINATANEAGEIIIRQGIAAALETKTNLEISGSIGSLLDFVKKRKKTIDPLAAHVIMDKNAGYIRLLTNEQGQQGTYEITGHLVPHPFIQTLGINLNKGYTMAQLINALKLNRIYFSSKLDHQNLIAAMMNFQARTEIDFTQANDFKGNVANSKIIKVKHEIPLDFLLTLPLFVGSEKQTIKIEVEVIPDNGSLVFMLISLDMVEYMDSIKQELFNTAEKALADYAIFHQ
jgi:hypothetical protein